MIITELQWLKKLCILCLAVQYLYNYNNYMINNKHDIYIDSVHGMIYLHIYKYTIKIVCTK